jgi:hypothetical protein
MLGMQRGLGDVGMDGWSLHWLEASGDLSRYRAEITAAFEQSYRAVSGMLPPPRLDILIQRLAGATIPGVGIVGYAHRSTMFSMTVDPDEANFIPSLNEGALNRQIIHEVHHCLRMAGPGYGHTLGEALVSEGLAGQFVRHLMGTPPEPWECAATAEILQTTLPSAEDLVSINYDHDAWFFRHGFPALPVRLHAGLPDCRALAGPSRRGRCRHVGECAGADGACDGAAGGRWGSVILRPVGSGPQLWSTPDSMKHEA